MAEGVEGLSGMMLRERRIVDNRMFLLGLDALYRTAMKRHEAEELRHCARVVAEELAVRPSAGPVEGYYAEARELTEYFRLMRALQDTPGSQRPRVSGLPEFRRLQEIVTAPLYGRPVDLGRLLPSSRDPLSQALLDSSPADWAVAYLLRRTRQAAMETDDYSLVGLAAWIQDPVVLTATRESVVLYVEWVPGSAPRPSRPKYVWAVDPGLARQASRFVDAFNALFREELPRPKAENAQVYWLLGADAKVVGRCARLGMDDSVRPIRHYHWAISPSKDGRGEVEEFWHEELWTTARYQRELSGRGPWA